MSIQIAIDGLAGVGKSTIAKILSKNLNAIYLDTGAMYRTVGLKAINSNIDIKNEKALSNLVENINIKILFDNEKQVMYLDDKNVSKDIRAPKISMAATNVALNKEVRVKMVQMQRDIAKNNDVVMDGRDIGTHVLKDANYKFFLVADVEERAKRRYQQLKEKNTDISLDSLIKDIKYRDSNDINRQFAPLQKAKDAIEIDTTKLSIKQVIEVIMGYINGKQKI